MSNLTLDNKRILIYDTECYTEDYCFVWKDVSDGTMFQYSYRDRKEEGVDNLLKQLSDTVLVGWNNSDYDDLMLSLFLDTLMKTGVPPTAEKMKELNDDIIVRKTTKKYSYSPLKSLSKQWAFTIDLMNIKKNFVTGDSLKEVAAKLGFKSIVETPISFEATGLTDKEWSDVVDYCKNDVNATSFIFDHKQMPELIEVRELIALTYTSIRSEAFVLGEAQIAEKVLLERYNGTGKEHYYPENSKLKSSKPKAFYFSPKEHLHPKIQFLDPDNQAVLERFKDRSPFEVGNSTGVLSPAITKVLSNYKFLIAKNEIALGQGGLHTVVKPAFIEDAIIDIDVNSYYPTLMTAMNLIPAGMDKRFTAELILMTKERLERKAAGDKVAANALKLVINSVFGKTGSKYSPLFDPVVLLQTTINGQLILMMLIELLELNGCRIIAGNTDGVMVQSEDNFDELINHISKTFDIEFSKDYYDWCVIRDVNNYVAMTKGLHSLKSKGAFGGTEAPIIPRAIVSYFVDSTPISQTIKNSTSLHDFNIVTKSSASSNKRQIFDTKGNITPANKVHRYYRSINGVTLQQGNTTTKSIQISDLLPDTFPTDVDFEYYITKAKEQANDIEYSIVANEERYNKFAVDLKELGAIVAPKGRYNRRDHSYTKALEFDGLELKRLEYWRDNQLTADNNSGCIGFGFYTGSAAGVLSIDIDDLDLAHNSGLFEHLPKTKGLITGHGDYVKSDVIRGIHTGTVSFLYQPDDDRLFDFIKLGYLRKDHKLGFEVFYNQKQNPEKPATIIQAFGKHPGTLEEYSFSGKLEAIPKKLKEWLEGVEATVVPVHNDKKHEYISTPIEINDVSNDSIEDAIVYLNLSKELYTRSDESEKNKLDYVTWRNLSLGIFSLLGLEISLVCLNEYWPEEKPNEYHNLLKNASALKNLDIVHNSLRKICEIKTTRDILNLKVFLDIKTKLLNDFIL